MVVVIYVNQCVAVRDHMLPSFSYITIRMHYRPTEVGDFSYVVRIENTKYPNSAHFIHVRSAVVSELRPVRSSLRCGIMSVKLKCSTC